ncbi:hypothetical protein MOTT12_02320 [Mycobacterium intracellulare subsp. yongonense]|nr:hypothetical protein MOTT12_02320 [Mycobacterium intracellulare subsp. yongonense]ARR83078.1 hypothetical protein MOTT27_02257 [Mycobacterium intracellulare subsp. yongonense]ETZ30140.1 hypothetical protein L842_2487 [Mycobacterium intracellulare MIN_052511_1280]
MAIAAVTAAVDRVITTSAVFMWINPLSRSEFRGELSGY